MPHQIERKKSFEFSGYIENETEFDWLNILLNVVPCGIIILDRWNKSEVLVNKEFLKIFNFVNENKGNPILLSMEDIKKVDLYESNGTKLAYEDFPTIKSLKGENIKDLELILETEINKEKRIITDSLPIYGKSGSIIAAITLISDISKFKKIEKDLVKAIKGRKLISQDFNDRVLNILNSMLNISEINEEYDNRDDIDENSMNPNELNTILLNFVHELLSSYDYVDEVELKEYIRLLFSKIQEIYDDKVDLNVYGHAPMTLDMIINCGLIINDIVVYRLQSYQSNLNINDVIVDRLPSFHNGNRFEMCIQLNSDEGKINVKISDNGPEVPFWAKNQIEKILELAYQLLEQLSGFIKIDSNKRITSFDFEFLYLEI
jgi:hypothetical protein